MSAVFDPVTDRWTLETNQGDVVTAQFCVMASGNLSTPRVPDFKGLESFQGKGTIPAFGRTRAWIFQVGVIGTGSSGVQMIPQIAAQADHLTIFQRTANFSLPARNAPLDLERERLHKEQYEERRRAALDTPFGIASHPAPTKSALEVTEVERQRAYEVKWVEGGSIGPIHIPPSPGI